MRIIVTVFLLHVSLFVTTCHAACCWDRDGNAFTGLDLMNNQYSYSFARNIVDKYCTRRPLCPEAERVEDCQFQFAETVDGIAYCVGPCNIPGSENRHPEYALTNFYDCPEDFKSKYFCKDGNERIGSFCGQGTCNPLGCGCGMCIGYRKLLQTDAPSTPTNSSKNKIAECQDIMVKKYNATQLMDKQQIEDYFNCLETVQDGVLDAKDASIQQLDSVVGGADAFKQMDASGNGAIEPVEFDSQLSTQASSASQMVLTLSVSICAVIIQLMMGPYSA